MPSDNSPHDQAKTDQPRVPGVVSVPLHREKVKNPPSKVDEANMHGTILDKARVGGVRHKFLYDEQGNKIDTHTKLPLEDVSK